MRESSSIWDAGPARPHASSRAAVRTCSSTASITASGQIDRARALSAKHRLSNVHFDLGDLDSYRPPEPVDLILMFDAFHHVLDPVAFIARVGAVCPRMFMVEPHGDWRGSWDRTSDLDWLPLTIQQIRERLEYQFWLSTDEQVPDGHRGHRTTEGERGAPTEHRYTLGDFERFFEGYALDVRGTIAGLEQYGAQPYRRNHLGDRLGDLTYHLVVSLEEILVAEGLDLAAKHWAIYADRTAAMSRPATRTVTHLRKPRPAQGVAPPYRVTFEHLSAPTTVRRGELFHGTVRIVNTGWLTWNSAADQPIFLSYHWRDRQGRTLVQDGLRTSLPHPVSEGQSAEVAMRVQAPDETGPAVLVIDPVHEGVAWFSDHGASTASILIAVSE